MAKPCMARPRRRQILRRGDLGLDVTHWICGLDESAPQTLGALDLGERVAVVLGSEGRGMRRLVRERCDHLARLPTRAEQPSINVSNAAAVALYELMARQ